MERIFLNVEKIFLPGPSIKIFIKLRYAGVQYLNTSYI